MAFHDQGLATQDYAFFLLHCPKKLLEATRNQSINYKYVIEA